MNIDRMMPYQTLDYRKALVSLIERARLTEPKLTYGRIAQGAKIQATYFSNVLKGRAHFSPDQLFLIGRAISAEGEEMSYLSLLLDWARSSVAVRRTELKKQIDMLRQSHLQTQKHLSATPATVETELESEYYLDPFVQIVHVYLGIAQYARNPQAIRRELGISPERLASSIRLLERLGYVAIEKIGGYRVLVKNRHLPQTSPICFPHQSLMRVKSTEQMSRLPQSRRYQVSVTFSTSGDVMEQLKAEFISFLQKAERHVKAAGAVEEEKVFQMNYDLFPWSLE